MALNNKAVLITGGTGSLGKALTAHIFKKYPQVRKVIIFSRDEQKQFQMAQEFPENTKVKNYVVNQGHPMFKTLRGIIMQFVGLDQIVDQIIKKLGNLDQVYLTGDLAEGRNSPFVDLIIVGEVDKPYLYQLIEKAEPLVQKKIRVGVYKRVEFKVNLLDNIGMFMKLVG